MVDISRIPGPGGPSGPAGSDKEKATKGSSHSHAFRELMKISETDTEQKKKKKGSGVEEDMGKAPSPEKTPSKVVPSFSHSLSIPKGKPLSASPPVKKKEPKKKADPSPHVEPPPPSPRGESAAPSPKKEEKKREVTPLPPSPPPPLAPAPSFLPAASSVSRVSLGQEAFELFTHMVGVILVLKSSGLKETTLTLSSTSALHGATVTIKEYSTAPLAFNIELEGSPQQAELFAQNVPALMTAFQNGGYDFTIHRIGTALLPEKKPLVHRKEKPQDGGLDQ